MDTSVDDLGLLSLAYESAGHPERWGEFLTALAERFKSHAAQFVVVDPRTFTFYANELHDASWREIGATYAQYADRDPRMASILASPRKLSTISNSIGVERYRGTDFYADFHRKIGADWTAVLYTPWTPATETSPLAIALALVRRDAIGEFDADTIAALERLVPHVNRAIGLHLHLKAEKACSLATERVVDQLSFGVVLVDSAARVHLMNRSARQLLDGRDGLSLRGDVVTAAAADEQNALLQLLRRTARFPSPGSLPGGTLTVSRFSGKISYTVVVLPPDRSNAGGPTLGVPLFALIVLDAEHRIDVRPRVLQDRFGLTPAETRLALAIVNGETVESFADAKGLSVLTVRTQMRSVLAKTECHRQTDLVRLLLRTLHQIAFTT